MTAVAIARRIYERIESMIVLPNGTPVSYDEEVHHEDTTRELCNATAE
jgi:hypothetical protein